MRLHTQIGQTNIGMVKSKPAFRLFFNLTVTPEEAQLIQTYQLSEDPLCRYMDNEGTERFLLVSHVIGGKGGHVFANLSHLNAMKVSMIEGCARFRDYLRQIQEVRAGGDVEIIDFALHQSNVQPTPAAAPPIAPEAQDSQDSSMVPPPIPLPPVIQPAHRAF